MRPQLAWAFRLIPQQELCSKRSFLGFIWVTYKSRRQIPKLLERLTHFVFEFRKKWRAFFQRQSLVKSDVRFVRSAIILLYYLQLMKSKRLGIWVSQIE